MFEISSLVPSRCTTRQEEFKARYKKIVYHQQALDEVLTGLFIESYAEPPSRIVLDLDATDDPVHGHQEERFLHGYYRGILLSAAVHPLWRVRAVCAAASSHIDPSAGALEAVERIVQQIRKTWPQVEIILRGGGGFCRESLMSWCEEHGVGYVFGLAKPTVDQDHRTTVTRSAAICKVAPGH